MKACSWSALRGVGKTVLLERMKSHADADGFYTIRAEAPEKRSLPALFLPQFRQTLVLPCTAGFRASSPTHDLDD